MNATLKIIMQQSLKHLQSFLRSLGKPVEFVGQYAQEVYFYCNPKYLERIKELMSFENIRAYVNSISAKKISVARLYKYIKDNIEEIE